MSNLPLAYIICGLIPKGYQIYVSGKVMVY